MSLILVKPIKPLWRGREASGMNPLVTDVRTGAPPPWLNPHCRRCGVPVETFTVNWAHTHFSLPVEVTCHGKTTGRHIPAEEVVAMSKGRGGIVWFFGEERLSASG